jgi:hypothetical protein
MHCESHRGCGHDLILADMVTSQGCIEACHVRHVLWCGQGRERDLHAFCIGQGSATSRQRQRTRTRTRTWTWKMHGCNEWQPRPPDTSSICKLMPISTSYSSRQRGNSYTEQYLDSGLPLPSPARSRIANGRRKPSDQATAAWGSPCPVSRAWTVGWPEPWPPHSTPSCFNQVDRNIPPPILHPPLRRPKANKKIRSHATGPRVREGDA